MTGNILSEYLVSLGFSVNQNQLRQFQNTLAGVSRQVESHTAGLVRSYTGAAAAVSSAILGITGATVGLLDQTAKADLEYQKFALRMFMTTDSAKRMKIALDAMGESIEDIAWFPELRERYHEFMQEQKGMMPPGSFDDQMRRIRDIRNEFARFTIIMNYGAQWVGHNLMKYLNVPIGEFQRWLIGVNDWLKENMPVWSDKIAYFLTKVISLGENAGKAINDLWNALSPREKLLTGVGGLVWLFSKSAFARAVAKILAVTAAIDDLYGFVEGKDSSKILSPVWNQLLTISKDLNGTIGLLKQSIRDLFDAMLPENWFSISGFWETINAWFGSMARLASVVALTFSTLPYSFGSDPETKKKYDAINKKIQDILDSEERATRQFREDMSMPYEERQRVRQNRFLSASGRATGSATDLEKKTMAFLVSRGVDPKKAAAVAGNIWAESSFQPGAIGDSGESVGLFQHNARAGRRQKLRDYAKAHGSTEFDPMMQLGYAMTEPEWDEAMAAMNRETTMHGMARAFMEKFEKPAIMELGARGSFADQAYQNWLSAGSSGGPVGPQSFNTTVGSLNVYVANTNATPEEIAKAVKEELYEEQAWSNARMMREAGTVFG